MSESALFQNAAGRAAMKISALLVVCCFIALGCRTPLPPNSHVPRARPRAVVRNIVVEAKRVQQDLVDPRKLPAAPLPPISAAVPHPATAEVFCYSRSISHAFPSRASPNILS
jgi:hypothetical protein